MTDGPDHISEHDLSDLLLGKLSDARQSVVEQHLEECQTCEARAAVATPQDGLVELLHRAAKSERAVPPPSGSTLFPQDVATPTNLPSTMLQADVPQADPTPSPPPGLAGHSRYRVIRLLGWGGMGQVWLAEHLVMGRPVALKVIRREFLDRPGMLDRFHREVQLAAKLNHPNIATAFDAEEIGGSLFLVMEFISGRTLAERVRGGPLPIAEACHVVREAARGLAHAHAAGLVHRDIKPGNLIQADDGTVKVLDFGLAISVQTDAQLTTGENVVLGTPDYVAPEQAEDPHAADARSDLYSLGCTLYHLLSGIVPFPEESPLRKIDAHRTRTPKPLPNHIPDELNAIIARMMAKRPDQRFSSAAKIVDALAPFCVAALMDSQDGKEAKTSPPPQFPLQTPPMIGSDANSTKWKLVTVGSLALIVVVALGIGLTIWKPGGSSNPPPNEKNVAVRDPVENWAKQPGASKPVAEPANHSVKLKSHLNLITAENERFPLLEPSKLGDGRPEYFRVEGSTLKINTLLPAGQLWLDFDQKIASRMEVRLQLRFLKVEESAMFKLAFLTPKTVELSVLVIKLPDRARIWVEQSDAKRGQKLLTSHKVPVDFADGEVELVTRVLGRQVEVLVNDSMVIETTCDDDVARYVCFAANHCQLEIREPFVLFNPQ